MSADALIKGSLWSELHSTIFGPSPLSLPGVPSLGEGGNFSLGRDLGSDPEGEGEVQEL
jgi:hypothetical protein